MPAFTPTFGGDGSGAAQGFYNDDDLRDNDVFPESMARCRLQLHHLQPMGRTDFQHLRSLRRMERLRQGKLCKQDVYVWRVAAVFIDEHRWNRPRTSP